MKPIINKRILMVILVAGLFFTYGCGHNSSGSGDYKAINVIGGSGDPATITNTANSPAEMEIGDIYSVTFSKTADGTIDFTGTDDSAQFILVVSGLDATDGTRSIRLSDEAVPADVSDEETGASVEELGWKSFSANEAFDQRLRGLELELARDPSVQLASPSANAAGLMKAMIAKSVPSVGDTETFKVLNSLSSFGSYKDVSAKVRCVGENVIFYVDTDVDTYNSSDLTDADVSTLCTNFDAAATREMDIFGQPSDINDDGRLAVLMTPQINRLGSRGGGIITGFFYSNDLTSSTNSNQREIVYVMVPDSAGVYGMTIPKAFAMNNLLPAVLPHEFQHAISYNLKRFVYGAGSEDDWLNEGLSHLSEDILGYGQENPSRAELFLEDPSAYGVVTSSSPNLAERGGIFLFLRYLYEQAADGEAFIHDLLNSELTGVANLEAAFAGASEDFDQLSEFVLRWHAALVMSSFNLSVDPRFAYKARTVNGITNQYEGVCLDCNTSDGRGTILTGVALTPYYGVSQFSIEPTAAKFYQVTSFPNTIELAARTTGDYGASLIRFE